VEFYNCKTVKTRKPTRCFLCRVKIDPGTEVEYESGKYDGVMFSRHSHPECGKEWVKENADSAYGDEWTQRLFENTDYDGKTFKAWQDSIIAKYTR